MCDSRWGKSNEKLTQRTLQGYKLTVAQFVIKIYSTANGVSRTALISVILKCRADSKFVYLLYPRSPKGEGGILFYLCPSKIFFVAFFSVTVDGRNLIIGHKRHIGIPYYG